MESDEAQIDIREFAMKCRSKHEVYTKLTVEEGIYLSDEANVNNNYIADIMQGRKSKDCSRINIRSFMVIRLSISKYLKYQGLGCRTSLTLP